MNAPMLIESGDLEVSSLPPTSLALESRGLVLRMFSDPQLLGPTDRAELVSQIREAVARHPDVVELRVVLGMALCVNLDVQPAIEELRTAVELAPHSYIAQLKMGELWMRLRVVDKAEAHTREASLLARNAAQVELARRQAAAIRTMRQNGIERGGYRSPLAIVGRLRRFLTRRRVGGNVVFAGMERPAAS